MLLSHKPISWFTSKRTSFKLAESLTLGGYMSAQWAVSEWKSKILKNSVLNKELLYKIKKTVSALIHTYKISYLNIFKDLTETIRPKKSRFTLPSICSKYLFADRKELSCWGIPTENEQTKLQPSTFLLRTNARFKNLISSESEWII